MKQAAAELKTRALSQALAYLTFRYMLVKRAYTRVEFDRMIGLTRFCPLDIREQLIGFEILLGKPRA